MMTANNIHDFTIVELSLRAFASRGTAEEVSDGIEGNTAQLHNQYLGSTCQVPLVMNAESICCFLVL
jgi:hypothetical protein